MAYGIHQFFQEKGFYYVHTPIITGSDTEGAGEMFSVTTLNLKNIPLQENGAIDFASDFFEKHTHLTVSGKLNGETAALALSDIYTFGPTFRAENSNTGRHLAEFWMIEPEMAFYDLNDNADLAEEFLKYLISYAFQTCQEDLEFLNKMYDNELISRLQFVLNNPFKRLTYTEAIDILTTCGKKFEFPVGWGTDLQSEHERYLVEQHFKCPVILTDYPRDIKAFYMRANEDGKTVRAMDVLFPGIGEIIGGSQREERLEALEKRIAEMQLPAEEYSWYLDTRRYGSAPHSGFGLGFERLLLFVTGMANIRDVIPFPRTPGNASF
jgi:asparaginyl-tRNA synthetase